ncbi:maleate cis-trans isomerase family protein [Amycolatopsis pithecellobii]|uniref:Asp/Glu racemase n=1 Tax=Amycolatopsis pithecellobii TaxID=664692 RepID=A0A6N7YZJ2_9PSEU|nr:aspartate/glutamate racemase family protein [Amycolatopsis pithecellobii]MTD54343.1 hypothetical protein [Amycolatopsis pithecellobii]
MSAPFEVGLMIPDSNTVTAPDIRTGLRDFARLHVETMHLPEPVTPDGELAMVRTHAPEAARKLAHHRPDLTVFGCSSAVSLLGVERAATFIGEISELAGSPVLGVNPCLIDALHGVGAHRIMLVSPYEQPLHDAVRGRLEAAGFDVVAEANMAIGRNADVGRVLPEEIVEFTLARPRAEADSILIACGNLRGYEAMRDIEARSGKPVVTANSAVIDAIVRTLRSDIRPREVPEC